MLSECTASKFQELEYLRNFVKNNPFTTVYDTEEAEVEVAKFIHFYADPTGIEKLLYLEVDKRDSELIKDQDAVRQSLESFF